MSTDHLVRFCSPTLAGIGVGNVFTCVIEKDELESKLDYYNELLNEAGICLKLIKYWNNTALIFVYRLKPLVNILNCQEVQSLLLKFGYCKFDLESCIDQLKLRLLESEFPHEIGIFLGYPLEDVSAFIENNGKNFKCLGWWKAYTNEDEAKKIFKKFDDCTRQYKKRLSSGIDFKELIVAV